MVSYLGQLTFRSWDPSSDELPVEIAKELEKTKQALAAKKLNKTSSSKLTVCPPPLLSFIFVVLVIDTEVVVWWDV